MEGPGLSVSPPGTEIRAHPRHLDDRAPVRAGVLPRSGGAPLVSAGAPLLHVGALLLTAGTLLVSAGAWRAPLAAQEPAPLSPAAWRVGAEGPGTVADPGAEPPDEALASWLPARIEGAVRRAIREGATPGAAVAVGHRGRVVLSRGFGRVDWRPDAAPVTDSTVYDLASLTKVIATATAAMQLVEAGRLDLDAPVHRYLPEWPRTGDHARIRVRDLLNHRSGLPAGGPLWRRARGRGAFLSALASMPLRSYPGGVERYGDYGMIVLGFVVESAAGATLDWHARHDVFLPLGMRDTDFRPDGARVTNPRIAPTEWVSGRHLRGEVHDPNARALDGVAGHAGLFSSARDLARFASALLWEIPVPLACRPVVEGFTRNPDLSLQFALGWESASRWSRWGENFSPLAFGHTGFTGTSIWIDPADEVFVVILTNRVNSGAGGRGHLDLRHRIHRAVRQALPPGEERVRPADARRADGPRVAGVPAAALRVEWEAREAEARLARGRTVGDGVRAVSERPCEPPPDAEDVIRSILPRTAAALR